MLQPSGANAYTDSVLAKRDPYAVQHASQPEMNIPAWTPEVAYNGVGPNRGNAAFNLAAKADARKRGDFDTWTDEAGNENKFAPATSTYENALLNNPRGDEAALAFANHMAQVDKMRGVGQGASYEDRRAAQTRNAEDRVAWRREGLTPTQNQVKRDVAAGKPLTVAQAIAAGVTNPTVLASLAKSEDTAATARVGMAGVEATARVGMAGVEATKGSTAAHKDVGMATVKANELATTTGAANERYKTDAHERIATMDRAGLTTTEIMKDTGMTARQVAQHKHENVLADKDATSREKIAKINATKNNDTVQIALDDKYDTDLSTWKKGYFDQKTDADREAYRANIPLPKHRRVGDKPSEPKRITGDADFASVAIGEEYIGPDGKTYRRIK
jgi:hypothetical protein